MSKQRIRITDSPLDWWIEGEMLKIDKAYYVIYGKGENSDGPWLDVADGDDGKRIHREYHPELYGDEDDDDPQ